MAAELRAAMPQATVSQRVVVLMTPDEKALLEARAKGAGVSVGEYVRRAAADHDDEADDSVLEELLALAEQSGREALDILDKGERSLDETLAYFKAKRGDHASG